MQSQIPEITSRFLFIIVLYKCDIGESATIQSLLNLKNILGLQGTIAIWDNSQYKLPESSLLKLKESFTHVNYYHSGKNESLAVVYNLVIQDYRKFNFEYVNIWDQDSTITGSYFTCLINAIKEQPSIPVFVPMVMNNMQIASPGQFHYFKGASWKSPRLGVVACQNIIAIMSGVVVKYSFFDNVRFDERLNVYGIDTKFFLDACKFSKFIYVFDYQLKHELSVYANEAVGIKLFRFGDFCHSLMIICRSKSLFSYTLSIFYLSFLSFKNTLRFKNLQFLKVFLNSFLRNF